jgi:hypothetical protein
MTGYDRALRKRRRERPRWSLDSGTTAARGRLRRPGSNRLRRIRPVAPPEHPAPRDRSRQVEAVVVRLARYRQQVRDELPRWRVGDREDSDRATSRYSRRTRQKPRGRRPERGGSAPPPTPVSTRAAATRAHRRSLRTFRRSRLHRRYSVASSYPPGCSGVDNSP